MYTIGTNIKLLVNFFVMCTYDLIAYVTTIGAAFSIIYVKEKNKTFAPPMIGLKLLISALAICGFVFGFKASYLPTMYEVSAGGALLTNILNYVLLYILCFVVAYYKRWYRILNISIKAILPKKLKYSNLSNVLYNVLVMIIVIYYGICLYWVLITLTSSIWLAPLISMMLFGLSSIGLIVLCVVVYYVFVAIGLWYKWLVA